MTYPAQELISSHYPESDNLIERLEENAEDVIDAFKTESEVVYTVRPDDLRQAPLVQIVLQKGRDRSVPAEQQQRTDEIDSTALLTSEFQRLHCGYCHTVYSEEEKADLAAHLRIKHRVEDPYLTESQLYDDDSLEKPFST